MPRKLSFRSHAVAVLAGVAIQPLMAEPALAYLDPGTGSLMIQMAIGAVAAAGAAVSVYWHRLRSFFSRHSPRTVGRGDADVQTKGPAGDDGISR
jgi:uncharacterized membrane protein